MPRNHKEGHTIVTKQDLCMLMERLEFKSGIRFGILSMNMEEEADSHLHANFDQGVNRPEKPNRDVLTYKNKVAQSSKHSLLLG